MPPRLSRGPFPCGPGGGGLSLSPTMGQWTTVLWGGCRGWDIALFQGSLEEALYDYVVSPKLPLGDSVCLLSCVAVAMYGRAVCRLEKGACMDLPFLSKCSCDLGEWDIS